MLKNAGAQGCGVSGKGLVFFRRIKRQRKQVIKERDEDGKGLKKW